MPKKTVKKLVEADTDYSFIFYEASQMGCIALKKVGFKAKADFFGLLI
jgi:hypothetical protein